MEVQISIGQKFKIRGSAYVVSNIVGDFIYFNFMRGGPANRVTRERFILLIEQEKIQFELEGAIPSATQTQRTLADYEDSAVAEVKLRKRFIDELDSVVDGSKATRSARIKQVADELGVNCPSVATVYRWRKAYLASGEDVRSLVSNHKRKGNRRERLSEEVTKIVESALSEWLSAERKSLKWVYDVMVGRIVEINSLRPVEHPLHTPDYATVARYAKKLDPFLVTLARQGKQAVERVTRSRMGSPEAPFLMSEVQIDHTVLDIVLSSGEIILGRPTLTVAIEKKTAAIVGFFIDFAPPSYYMVAECLKHVLRDKSYIKGKYPGIKNEWNSFGLPYVIYTDNGKDFLSRNFEIACFELEISIVVCPPRSPWFKGQVERFLGTINKGLVHNIAGTTKSNIFDRGDYDSLANSVLSLEDFEAVFHKWLVDVYMQTRHSRVGTSPAKAWERLEKITPPRPPRSDINLDILLGENVQRKISNGRVYIDNLAYASPVLSAIGLGPVEHQQVDIKRNVMDLGTVFVLHPVTKQYVEVNAVDWKYARGLPKFVHLELQKAKRGEDAKDDFYKVATAKKELADEINQIMGKKNKRTRKKAARAAGWANEVITQQDELLPLATTEQPGLIDDGDLDGEEFIVVRK